MDYSTFVATINSYAGYDVSASTTVELDSLINLATARIYRDIDYPHARSADTGALTIGDPEYSILSPDYPLVIRDVYITNGTTRAALQSRDESFMHEFWPDATATAQPRFYSVKGDRLLEVAPTPDLGYGITIYMSIAPEPLSASNATSWLGDNEPDLLLAATMLQLTTYHKGEQAQVGETPASPGFWQAQYEKAAASAKGRAGSVSSDGYAGNR